jgi:hypothetical protein
MSNARIRGPSWSSVASYLLGAAAAWFSVYVAFLIYAITPLFFITPVQKQREPG